LRPITNCEHGCSDGKGGTYRDYMTMGPNGTWVYHSTKTYTTAITWDDGNSGILTVTIRKSGNSTSGAITLMKGPTPKPPTKEGKPKKYVHENNGVCIYAVASSCDTVPQPTSAEIPDLPCAAGESETLCGIRNSYHKTMVSLGPALGMMVASKAWGEQGLVTVYRVEGAGNQRIKVLDGGFVTLKNAKKPVFLNFGVKKRADDFLEKRLSQGFSDSKIKAFEVEEQFVDWLRQNAVPESMAKDYPGMPLRWTLQRQSISTCCVRSTCLPSLIA
jgi:hypothetical protein